MKAQNRRKQILCPRVSEVERMSTMCDPFLSADNVKVEYIHDDSFINSDAWGIESDISLPPNEQSGTSSLDMYPISDLYLDEFDMNAILEMDLNDPALLLNGNPSQENQEIFQDVKYTSTPKSVAPETVEYSQVEPSRKRPLFHVLRDITDSVNSSNNESFININNVLKANPPEESQLSFTTENQKFSQLFTPPHSAAKKCGKQSPGDSGRKVGIIRKMLPIRTPDILTPEPSNSTNYRSEIQCSSEPSSSKIMVPKSTIIRKDNDEEKLIYYSGIDSYYNCLALIKHIKLPRNQCLSSFKMQLITFMKLRLDLQWKDIAYRFDCDENIIRKVFKDTVEVFSDCLIELLPWHSNKKNVRKNHKLFYLHTVKRHDYQVVLVIGDGRKPVNFVSSVYMNNEDPLSIIVNECNSVLMQGDVLYLNDSMFRIGEEDQQLCLIQLENRSRSTNVAHGHNITKKMMSVYPLLSLESDIDLCQVMITVAALTNLNHMPNLTPNKLKVIYEKSVEFLYTKQSQISN